MSTRFSDKLRQIRRRLRMTQKELADVLDVSTARVSEWEREVRVPSALTQEGIFARLAKLPSGKPSENTPDPKVMKRSLGRKRVVRCPVCGAAFDTDNPNRRYCNRTCRDRGLRTRRKRQKRRRCLVCEQLFETRLPNMTTCSMACHAKRTREFQARRAERNPVNRNLTPEQQLARLRKYVNKLDR